MDGMPLFNEEDLNDIDPANGDYFIFWKNRRAYVRSFSTNEIMGKFKTIKEARLFLASLRFSDAVEASLNEEV